MFIDTTSIRTIEKSVCDCLNVSKSELYSQLDAINLLAGKGENFDSVRFNSESKTFIDSCKTIEPVDLMFYHFGRRLNSDKSVAGCNLKELLLTENSFSEFLKKHGVTFLCNEKIIPFYKGSEIDLPDQSDRMVTYLRNRLGYNIGYEDYYFNGFAFNNTWQNSSYVRSLGEGSEFLRKLAEYIKADELVEDYRANSRYYCFIYAIPMKYVIFDGCGEISDMDKRHILLNECFEKLIKQEIENRNSEGLRLRLKENVTIDESWFIERKEIKESLY